MSDQSPAPTDDAAAQAAAAANATTPAAPTATSAPVNGKPQPWAPPTEDQEFKFESIDAVPAWVDKGWASWKDGPALAVPMGDLWGEGPYHTGTARIGDTVKFLKATPSKAAHFEIIAGEPEPGKGTKRPPQQTNASLEDQLKTGYMSPDDLGDDARGQVLARSPRLAPLIEEGRGAPEPVSIPDVVKVS